MSKTEIRNGSADHTSTLWLILATLTVFCVTKMDSFLAVQLVGIVLIFFTVIGFYCVNGLTDSEKSIVPLCLGSAYIFGLLQNWTDYVFLFSGMYVAVLVCFFPRSSGWPCTTPLHIWKNWNPNVWKDWNSKGKR